MTTPDEKELWERLDALGLPEVRKRRAKKVYGARKLSLVDEWIHQKEQRGGLILPDDPVRKAIFDELKTMDREAFKGRISKIKDDGLLGYLRYEFDWDPDPRKSTWQAIEINRLLTTRKNKRLIRPTWVGVFVAIAIGIASLIVAIIGL
jgi:hypothetical protein